MTTDTERFHSPEAEQLETELSGLEGDALANRLVEDADRISHILAPDELTELVERRFEVEQEPDAFSGMLTAQAAAQKARVLATYATEYFTHFGTYSSITEESKDRRRTEAFTMQGKALQYALTAR
jgi:hypothetical protein